MTILNSKGFFAERDPFSEIPGILSIFNFFLRNGLLANPLLSSLIPTFNSLAPDSFSTQDRTGKGCHSYRYWRG